MESIFHYSLLGGESAVVTAVSEQCFRIRIQKEGDPESALNRYSIIQEPAVTFPLKVEEEADALDVYKRQLQSQGSSVYSGLRGRGCASPHRTYHFPTSGPDAH